MEKFRRKIEQKNLLVRLNRIEERLKDIDKEKTALISRLAKEKDHKGVKSLIRSSLPAHNPPPSTRSGGLRYAY